MLDGPSRDVGAALSSRLATALQRYSPIRNILEKTLLT